MMSFVNSSDQGSNSFVQFRILSPLNAESAQKIDEKIGSKSGIIESRSDYVTSTYFCLLSPESEYTKDDFVSWFAKMGYEIACYSRGIQNVDPMVSPHVLKDCEDVKGE
ncbi:MAG: hypothetical protein IPM77_04975 [Crocinitomicaceae bacterium]|nr:hypothetical protein [Crocinitomicaceae bacterium]